MEYSVKVSAAGSFDDVVKLFPEVASAVAGGITFMQIPLPAPAIDMGKLRGAQPVASQEKKPGRKM